MGLGRKRTNGEIYSAIKELTRVTKNCSTESSPGASEAKQDEQITILNSIITELLEQGLSLDNLVEIENLLTTIEGNNTANQAALDAIRTEVEAQTLALGNLDDIETLLTTQETNNGSRQVDLLSKLDEIVDLQGDFETLKQQSDWTRVYTFLDPGTDDERISSILHTSAIAGLVISQVFVWAGTSPNFYLQSNTLS